MGAPRHARLALAAAWAAAPLLAWAALPGVTAFHATIALYAWVPARALYALARHPRSGLAWGMSTLAGVFIGCAFVGYEPGAAGLIHAHHPHAHAALNAVTAAFVLADGLGDFFGRLARSEEDARRAEEDARRAGLNLDAVAGLAGVTLGAFAPDGTITRALGEGGEGLLGRSVDEVFGDYSPEAGAAMSAVRAGRAPEREYVTTRDGRTHRVRILANALPGGGYWGAVEVSEERRALAEAEASAAALRRVVGEDFDAWAADRADRRADHLGTDQRGGGADA